MNQLNGAVKLNQKNQKKMSKLYDFDVTMCGWGDSVEEAWENCKENFNIDNQELPEFTIVDEDE